jgi:hypothetical protein
VALRDFNRSSAFFVLCGIVVPALTATAAGDSGWWWGVLLGGLWPFLALAWLAAVRPMSRVAAALSLLVCVPLTIGGVWAGLTDSSSTAAVAIPMVGMVLVGFVLVAAMIDLAVRARKPL